MPSSRMAAIDITSTAKTVSRISQQLIDYLARTSHTQPNLSAVSAAVPETIEYELLRNQLTDAANDLILLANGPKNSFRSLALSHTNLAALQVALTSKIFTHVPLECSGLSASAIASKIGIDEDRTRRILKLLVNQRIFEEHDDSYRHSAASAFLKTSVFSNMVEAQLDEGMKASAQMNTSVAKSPMFTAADNCAFHEAFNSTLYKLHDEVKAKGERFSRAMQGWSLVDDSYAIVSDGFPWASLSPGTKIVDMGGGSGHVSINLAREHQSLEFVVQDISPTQRQGAGTDAISKRISFMHHDFFDEQPVCDAKVYLCRAIFHNHNDDDAVRMLQAIVPALEQAGPDARLLINDVVVPERAGGAITRAEEAQHRQLDLLMLALFGAKERTETDWKSLFAAADHRLTINRIEYNPRGAGIIELQLQ